MFYFFFTFLLSLGLSCEVKECPQNVKATGRLNSQRLRLIRLTVTANQIKP